MGSPLPLPIRVVHWLQQRSSAPALVAGLVPLSVLMGVYYFSGLIFPAENPLPNALEISGLFLLLALMPSYLLVCFVSSVRANDRHHAALSDKLPESTVASWPRYGYAQHWPWFVLLALVNALLFNVGWGSISFDPDHHKFVMSVLLIPGQLVLWGVAGVVLFFSIHECLLLRYLGRHVPVNLYRLDELNDFGRTGLNNFLMVVGALALTTVQSIDQELRWFNYFNALLVGIPAAVALVYLPIWTVHEKIVAEKNRQLMFIDEKIRLLAEGDTLTGEPLIEMNGLLDRRAWVRAQRNWPMDLSIATRFALYVFIPPIAWSGAAFVEYWLGATLGF